MARKAHRDAGEPDLFSSPAPKAAESDAAYRSLTAAREDAAHRTRCPLYRDATQTVFGEGPAHARVMFTVHPSFLLRLPDAVSKEREYEKFIADLKLVAKHLPEVRTAA